MKIEKLNDNKIRITLGLEDLKEKNIDFHSFMSNSSESQSLFLDMLREAEKEVGFVTKDHKLMIEAIAMADGNFVLTVTKDTSDNEKLKKNRIHIKRKSVDLNKPIAIYSFETFDDFCSFCNFLNDSAFNDIVHKIETISLYEYQKQYYLCLDGINVDVAVLKGFCTAITEFGSYVNNAELFERKLKEYGTILIEENAIDMTIKHFGK